MPLAFAGDERVQAREGGRQFAGRRTKRPGHPPDLAENHQGKQSARFQPPEDCVVEPVVPKLVADNQVDRRTGGKTVVQVGDVEATPFADADMPGQIPCVADGNGRDIPSPDLEPAQGEPHGDPPLPASEIEGMSRDGQELRVARQDVRQPHRTHRRRSLNRIPLIPPTPVDPRHSRHPKAATEREKAPPARNPVAPCDKIGGVKPRALFGIAVAAASALLGAPVVPAVADPCPDVEVVFARGTAEPPGVGRVGQNFVDTLRPHLGARTLDVYPVNYPATTDFPTALDGVTDAGTHVEHMAVACPRTRMVLGGYSQGAAVIGFVTANAVPEGVQVAQALQPMPPGVAGHVAAVALFGKPSARFMNIINEPPVTIGPLYTAKTIDLCIPGDAVCAGGDIDPTAHRSYVEAGMVDQAADFTANHL